METTTQAARRAGLIYLSMVACAPFGLMYVPGKLIVRGDAAATAHNLVASETLFRLGGVAIMMSAVVFVFLALALYRLLKGVSPMTAVLMVLLVAVQVPITFLNEASWYTAMVLAKGASYLDVFSAPQREALAMVFIRMHAQGMFTNEIFWGLWLLPFGWLVFRSGFLPKWIGAWLLVNGVTYVVVALVGLLNPDAYGRAFNLAFPLLFGELAVMLWMLIFGAKPRPLEAPRTASA